VNQVEENRIKPKRKKKGPDNADATESLRESNSRLSGKRRKQILEWGRRSRRCPKGHGEEGRRRGKEGN